MTQSKDELREKILEIIEYWDFSPLQDEDSRIKRLEAQMLNVITTAINKELEAIKVNGETSDGYHTFNELYDYRRVYNAALFNEWAKSGKYDVHKSKKHSDGQDCFGGGWFIVVAELPNGQISNHYELEHWEDFQIPTRPIPNQYDGHTPQEALGRLTQVHQIIDTHLEGDV